MFGLYRFVNCFHVWSDHLFCLCIYFILKNVATVADLHSKTICVHWPGGLEFGYCQVVASTLSYSFQAYKREERLAAQMLRQKESRHQSYMKSREELIASSITTAFSGGERERQPVYHHKVSCVEHNEVKWCIGITCIIVYYCSYTTAHLLLHSTPRTSMNFIPLLMSWHQLGPETWPPSLRSSSQTWMTQSLRMMLP